jgi:hypothetical protein
MTNREFRQKIADMLARQREERLEALRDEVRTERKSPGRAEIQKPKTKRRKAS